MPDNFWGDIGREWLEENPFEAFRGALQGWGTRPQRRRLQDQFPDIYGDFMGRLSQQLLGGQIPTEDWVSQMRNPQDIFNQRWGQMTPYEKYGSTSQLAPSARLRF